MDHDRFIKYIDIDLKETLTSEAREYLLELHNCAIHQAKLRGIKIGQRLIEDEDNIISPEPEGPPNELVKDEFPWWNLSALTVFIASLVFVSVVLF